MQPGDELYFYVTAIDNHQPGNTFGYLYHSPPGYSAVNEPRRVGKRHNLKRNISGASARFIIETEQLLKDKDTISIESFKNRSNNLGIDQKLLRLRYGSSSVKKMNPVCLKVK